MKSIKKLAKPLSLAALLTITGISTSAQAGYYEDFGQKAGIASIISDFVGVVAADNRINSYFAHANIPHLKEALTNQVCEALGGPCKYTGPAMGPMHQSMGVTQAAFNALTEDLITAMTNHHVSVPAQNHLIKILAPMSNDIITK
ncbi:group 1 truncated hemoglobin [Halothiobacillus sp. DCM-1]|uniref:group I truncated hemoglobin n=1 Tax=Halothiobacillus sp. DCM-1 TaxID=3112558 RepID=UPI00324911DE